MCLFICSPIFLDIAASSASKSNANYDLPLLSNPYFSYSRKEHIESPCIFVNMGLMVDSVRKRFTVRYGKIRLVTEQIRF